MPKIIVFEGIDGCGKDTQLSIFEEKLKRAGKTVAVVKHPGYTDFGWAVRDLILNGPQPSNDMARRVLFLADALNAAGNLPDADVVLFNRHMLYSNVCYGEASGSGLDQLLAINRLFTRWTQCLPDLTLVFDLPAEIAFRRIHKRGEEMTSVEKNGCTFMERVRRNYTLLASDRAEMRAIRCFEHGRELTVGEIATKVDQLCENI